MTSRWLTPKHVRKEYTAPRIDVRTLVPLYRLVGACLMPRGDCLRVAIFGPFDPHWLKLAKTLSPSELIIEYSPLERRFKVRKPPGYSKFIQIVDEHDTKYLPGFIKL